jgi:hypothetical protein
MIYQLGGCKPLAAKRTVINRTIRITGDLGDFAVFGIDQNTAAAMTHSAMAFDNPVKSVGLYFLFDVGVFKFSHVFSLLLEVIAKMSFGLIFLEPISKIGFWFKIPSSPKGFAGTRAAVPSFPTSRDFPPDLNIFVGRDTNKDMGPKDIFELGSKKAC